MKLLVSLVLLFGVGFSVHGQTAQRCLSAEPAAVTLKGRITRRTFAGRPNYESIKKGDEPETYWILHLARPVCVLGDDFNDQPEKNVSKVQLVFSGSEPYARYKKFFSKRVVVGGKLFHANTGHHHTKVLIMVSGMKGAQL